MTRLIKLSKNRPDLKLLKPAADCLRNGGLVAFPTETVYGLGANALDEKAVGRIFAAKGRPPDNPLIVHVADAATVKKLARQIPPKAKRLMRKFWPGPLTLVLKKRREVPDIVTAGLDTVAVRMPSCRIALALIKQAGVPVAAPSANLSGCPSTTTAAHAIHDMNEKVDFIIDGGSADIGLESTVLDVSSGRPVLLRPGKISPAQLERVAGPILLSKGSPKIPKSPGMKYRHYAPEAQVVLFNCGEQDMKIRKLALQLSGEGRKVAVICRGSCGFRNGPSREFKTTAAMAKGLFASFREFDRMGVEVIIARGVPEKGIGIAVMNRLRKAALKA